LPSDRWASEQDAYNELCAYTPQRAARTRLVRASGIC
jgi:hypothetical protein